MNKIIFGRDNPDFDYLFLTLKKFKDTDLKFLEGKDKQGISLASPKKITIELATRMFIDEDFDSVRSWNLCNVCLSNMYASPLHKNMIDEYIPDAPTSLSEIYCQIVKDVGDIGLYDNIADLVDTKRPLENAESVFLLNRIKFNNQIEQQITLKLSELDDAEDEAVRKIK